MTDPQPTRGAQKAAHDALMNHARQEPAGQHLAYHIALALDRFAAQHSEAAPSRKPDVPCPVTGNTACEFGYCRETPGCYLRECGYLVRQHPTAAPVSGDALERAQTLWLQTICGGKDDKTDDEIIILIATALTAARSEGRRAAIEECARIADEAAGLSATLRLTNQAEDIAANIRALAAAPPGDGG